MREYLNISDIARARGVSRQTVNESFHAGSLPKPDGVLGARRSPIWRRTTLERAGVLDPLDGGQRQAESRKNVSPAI